MSSVIQSLSLNGSAEALAWLSQLKGMESEDIVTSVTPVLRDLASSPRPVYAQLGILETLRLPILQATHTLLAACAFRPVPMAETEVSQSRKILEMVHLMRDAYHSVFHAASADPVNVPEVYAASDFRRDPTLRDRLAAFSSQIKSISPKLLISHRMISAQALYIESCFRLRVIIPEAAWDVLVDYTKQAKQADLINEGVMDSLNPEFRFNARMAVIVPVLLRLARPESLGSSGFTLASQLSRRHAVAVKFRVEEGEEVVKPSPWPSVVTSTLNAIRLDTRNFVEEIRSHGAEFPSRSTNPTLGSDTRGLDTRFSHASLSSAVEELLLAWRSPVQSGPIWRKPLQQTLRIFPGFHAITGGLSKPAAIFDPNATIRRSVYKYRRYDADYVPDKKAEDPTQHRLRLLMETAERWHIESESAQGLICSRSGRHPRLQLDQLGLVFLGENFQSNSLLLVRISSLRQTLPVENSQGSVQEIGIALLRGASTLISIRPDSGTFEDAFLLGVAPNGISLVSSRLVDLDFEHSSLIVQMARHKEGSVTELLLDGALHRIQIGQVLFRGRDFDQMAFKLL